MRVPLTRQPGPATAIDWSNPITQGLVYADPGQFGRNLVTGQPSSALTGTKVQGSAYGLVRGYGSTFGTGSTDANVTSLTTQPTQRTYLIRAMRNGAGGGGLGRILEKRTGGAQSELIFWSNGISRLQYGRVFTTTNGQWDFPAGTLDVGVPQVIAVAYDYGSTANDPLFYVNGALQTVTESSAPSGAPVGNSDAYVIGNRTNDNLRNWDGWIGEVLIWDRILSPAEIARISANPWQIFRPIVVPVKAPAGGGITLTAAQGTYTLTGQSVNLTIARRVTAEQGTYTLTGQSATLRLGKTLTVAQGTYTLTGQSASLLISRQITLAQGSYTLTGQGVTLTKSGGDKTLAAGHGTYTLTGHDVSLSLARKLTAEQGTYTLNGQAVGLNRNGRVLQAAQGAYTLNGQEVTLNYSGQLPNAYDIVLARRRLRK